ncbi:PREDICTED: putative FBD-associated F-box protein At5g53635 [Camelina sativa]|uniref:FBD-associated F-box protein At5g53635 n=1 Tax=Camelina sativa TaxID=90675 RepID=A0ABM1R9E1_CAMSA|nr:PREDICTED: putative FBD-associated F-box protein At5g53635 [Camelina sativa]
MEDRISQLPDPVICHILSHLPTEEIVKTSVLSTRWTTLWLWVACLELNLREFPDFGSFVNFGNRFFDSNRVSSIENLNMTLINYSVGDAFRFTSWIDGAVKRKVQHLHVRFLPHGGLSMIRVSLYICETLVSLKIQMVALPNAEFVSLPCLKIMHLGHIRYPNEATFERLVSSCPVLEELVIQGSFDSNEKVFRVISRSLKKLSIELMFCLRAPGSGFVIDAPRLHSLSIDDNLPESFTITNMDSNVKLLYEYSKLESLPRFGYMSRLDIDLSYSHMKWLPSFLESFPKLKSLNLLCCDEFEEMSLRK